MFYSTVSTASGLTTCKVTVPSIPAGAGGRFTTSYDAVLTNSTSFFGTPLPSSYLSSLGFVLPPNCSQVFPGNPVAQIPVQYLTSTSIINRVPVPTTIFSPATSTAPASPGSAPPQVTPSVTQNIASVGSAPIPSDSPGDSGTSQGSPSNPVPNPDPNVSGSGSIPQTTVTFGGIPFTISNSKLSVESQTLVPGGAPVTISGTFVSLAPSATAIVIGTSTFALTPGAEATEAPVFTFGSSIYTENPGSSFIIDSQTLTPGGEITIDGTVISLVSSATAVVVGSSTFALSAGGAVIQTPVVTVDNSIYTENSASVFVIGGQTLTPGGEIIVSGTALSLLPGGSVVVVGSQTETLSPASPAASDGSGLGGLIYSAFNGGNTASTTGGPGAASTGMEGPIFTGAAPRPCLAYGRLIVLALVLITWNDVFG